MNETRRDALVEKYSFECKAYSARRALQDAVEDAMKRMFPSDEGDYVVTVHKVANRAVPEPDADAVKHLQEFADMFHFAWGLWVAQDGATPLETEHLKRAMDDVFWSDMILKWSEMVEEGIIANPGLEAQDREIEDVKNRPAWLLPEHTRAALAAVPTVQAAAVEPEPGLSLDAVEAMLDDPNVVSALGRSFAQRRNGEADYESRPSYRSFCDGEGVSEVEAALAVMREVQAAVRQAKENGDG